MSKYNGEFTVFHSSSKPHSVIAVVNSSPTLSSSTDEWNMGLSNYIDIKKNSGWRTISNCPCVYSSPESGLCSCCNWFPVRSILLHISTAPYDCSHTTVHTLSPRSFLGRSSIETESLCWGYCHRKKNGHREDYCNKLEGLTEQEQ